jgi:SAM-dependent methyltransferase
MTETRRYWDTQAADFDDAPDHGLLDPAVRAAWVQLLAPRLPGAPARVADLGCGTGTLSVLLAERGHLVRGVDVAPEMVRRAQAKALAAGVDVSFMVGDAAVPAWPPATCDLVISRHVLWAMDEPGAALNRWLALLVPDGQLLLIEGLWHNGAGLAAADTLALVCERADAVTLTRLPDPALWGGPIRDERYLVEARRRP